jgi:hypothetical protein
VPELERRKAEAVEAARASGALTRCEASLTEEVAACAEQAPTADELERCFP